MVFKGNVLTAKLVVDNVNSGKWKLKGMEQSELLTWHFNNKYYNVYNRVVNDDCTTFYAFDDNLKLYKIIRRNKIDREIENGVITDILEIDKGAAEYQEQLDFEEDIEGYKNE